MQMKWWLFLSLSCFLIYPGFMLVFFFLEVQKLISIIFKILFFLKIAYILKVAGRIPRISSAAFKTSNW